MAAGEKNFCWGETGSRKPREQGSQKSRRTRVGGGNEKWSITRGIIEGMECSSSKGRGSDAPKS